MSRLNGREIKSVRMHSVIQVDKFGQAGPTIDKVNSPKGPGGKIRMIKESDGVKIEFTYKGELIEAFVPNGNITNVTFEPEVVKAASSKVVELKKGD